MKSNYIHIRVTEEQKQKIKQNAEKYNLSITEYVLQSINNMTEYNNLVNYVRDKKLEYKELSFCLTVIRDNCSCDNTCEYLDLLIKNIEKNF